MDPLDLMKEPTNKRPRAASWAFAVAALVAVAWGAYLFWPSDERKVRGRLDALAEVLNERPRDGLGMVAQTAQLTTFFTEDVILEPGGRAGAIRGRERLLALASRAPAVREFEIDFVDVSVEVTGETAASRMTATLTSRPDPAESESVDAREIDVQWRREDDWRIARITLIDPLQRPEP